MAEVYPAGDLEGLVIDRLRAFFVDPGAVLDAIEDESFRGLGQSRWVERGRDVAEELGTQAPNAVKTTLMTLQYRVEIKPEQIAINISQRCLAAFLAGRPADLTTARRQDRDFDDVVTLVAPGRSKAHHSPSPRPVNKAAAGASAQRPAIGGGDDCLRAGGQFKNHAKS